MISALAGKSQLQRRNAAVFATTWCELDSGYYDPSFGGANWRSMAQIYGPRATTARNTSELYGILNEMLGTVRDPHTGVIPPGGRFAPVDGGQVIAGFHAVHSSTGEWVIDDVFPQSSAERAGVETGWICVSCDGHPPFENVRTSKEDAHTWRFVDRYGRNVVLQLASTLVSDLHLDATLRQDGILYIRFDRFSLMEAHWLSQQLKSHQSAVGCIIDLRKNRGGSLLGLELGIGEFFDRPIPFAYETDRNGVDSVLLSSTFGSARFRSPVSVLVDGDTTSAAEIFAESMKLSGRAQIVGRRTPGSVNAARLKKLPDGGWLEYSFASVRGLRRERIEGVGVEPDVFVPQASISELRAGIDRDIEAADKMVLKRIAAGLKGS
jgi:carboxyl-terminal processing protease